MITITEKNIKWVYGMLRKFLYNKNKTGFVYWHNFDCGKKRRISKFVETGDGRIHDVTRTYTSPEILRMTDKKDCIIISFIDDVDSTVIQYGDQIAFQSGKVQLKQKWYFPMDHKYVYSVIQAKHLSHQETDECQTTAEIQKAFNEDIEYMLYDDEDDEEYYDPEDFEECDELNDYHGE